MKGIVFTFVISAILFGGGIFIMLYYKDKDKKFLKNEKQLFGLGLLIFGSIGIVISIYKYMIMKRLKSELESDIFDAIGDDNDIYCKYSEE